MQRFDGTNDPWMVVAVIQPFRLDAVTLALRELPDLNGMTVSTCRGLGRDKLEPGQPRTDPGLEDFTGMVRLEVAVGGQEQAEAIVNMIARASHTGNRGDRVIFGWPLGRAVHVRTFDEGARAL